MAESEKIKIATFGSKSNVHADGLIHVPNETIVTYIEGDVSSLGVAMRKKHDLYSGLKQ